MAQRAYFDWNASAPLHPAARSAMIEALTVEGNPSSVHSEGRAARRLVEDARQAVAALAGAEPRNVVFTSGGTEANALALTPGIAAGVGKPPCGALIVSAIEHPSVRIGHRFPPESVHELPVTAGGEVDLAALADCLRRLRSSNIVQPLLSLMAANNETGVIQPVAEAADMIHAAGGLVHVDATQAPGRIPCTINAFDADLTTISAHKMGGPKGAGALVRRTEAFQIEPLIRGGGQERGHRAGTENVAAIAGFGAAAVVAHQEQDQSAARMKVLQHRLEGVIRQQSSDAVIFGAGSPRLPNTTLVSLPGTKAETTLITLDLAGIAVSSGSACSSGKVAPSHVLSAMGVPAELARGALRISLGPATSEDELDAFAKAWIKLAKELSKRRAA